jgi:protoporphyrinogen oxidase
MSDLNLQTASPPKVAIVGSGPSGLVAARFLKQHGFEPVLFEQNDAIGGHLEVSSTNDAVRKAETIMQIIYPEANVFDSYNLVNEHQDPDEVLRFAIG